MSLLEDLSFREKSAVASLVAVLIVYGGYFADLLGGEAERTLSAMLYTSIGVVISLIVIQVVFHILLAMFGADDAEAPADERDRLIDARAARIAYSVLSVGAVIILGRILFRGAMDEASAVAEVTLFEVANLLLFFLVLAEICQYGARVYFYRRGIVSA